jgi:O-antigen biosynthesis protein WbqV
VSESGLFEIARELRSAASHCEIFEILCDIRDQAAVARAFARSGPQLVFHAAALKHVAMQERHPCEAVLTNVLGTANVLTSSGSAEQLVLISTDKAVAPSSVMGATKRLAEAQLLSAANTNARSLTTVRFGNVLGSAGSVVPIFRKQIEQGGPVTVTDSAMERYFMTIPEAVQLVLYSAALADAEKGANRLFVLEMGEPVRIIELARRMIALMGMRPDVDVPIEVIGRKPGEKLTEELVDEDEIAAPFCQGILEVRRPHECALLGHAELAELIDSASNGGNERTRQLLFQAVAALRQRQVRRQRA